jgi:hypothetical protein
MSRREERSAFKKPSDPRTSYQIHLAQVAGFQYLRTWSRLKATTHRVHRLSAADNNFEVWSMVENLFRDDFVEIEYDDEAGYLCVNWQGYQTDKSIKDGINFLIDSMTRYQVFKVLNDNANTLGIWIGVASWLIFDALPRARQAGMKSFAHVYGTSRLSRISADAALLLLNPSTVDVKAFDDIQTAKDWLRNRP